MSNTEKKSIKEYTAQELLALPVRDWDKTSQYDSILLLPSNIVHDSGYQCMVIIRIINHTPIEIACNCCDDIEWIAPDAIKVGNLYPIGQMRMDCLPTSKAFHAWNRGIKFQVESALSSITIEVINILKL